MPGPTENPIDKIPQKKLSRRQLRKLAAFISPADVVDLIGKADWSVAKSIDTLVEIAKASVSDNARITAIRCLNQLIVDAMTRSGLIASATHTITSAKGDRLQFSGNVVTSVLQGQQDHTTIDDLTKNQNKDKEQNNGTDRAGQVREALGQEDRGTGAGTQDPISPPRPIGEPEAPESGQTEDPETVPRTTGEDETGTDKSQGETGGKADSKTGDGETDSPSAGSGPESGISVSKPPSTKAAKEHFRGIATGGDIPTTITDASFI